MYACMYVGPFVNAMLEDDIVFAINAMDSSMEMQINLLEDEGLRRTYIHTYIYVSVDYSYALAHI